MIFFQRVNAQVTREILLVTPFKTEKDFDILFPQSMRVLAYLEGENVEEPLFLSLSNATQKEILEKNAFKPRLIDANADINRYVLLYSPLENQEVKLAPFGEPIKILKHYTLLKLPVGATGDAYMSAGAFFKNPFLENIQKPPKETPVMPKFTPIVTATPITPTAPKSDNNTIIIVGGVVLVLVLAGGVGAYIFLKRKKQQVNEY